MEHIPKPSSFSSRFTELQTESHQIFQMFESILSELTTRRTALVLTNTQTSFNSLCESFSSLSLSLQSQIRNFRSKSSAHSKNCSKIRLSSQHLLSKNQKQIALKENLSNKTQESISQSLIHVKKLWQGNLKTMKNSLKKQEILKNEVRTHADKLDKEISQELAFKTLDKELISQASAFEIPLESHEIKNLSRISGKSQHVSNSSIEFEKCMAELDVSRQQPENGNISIEKSFGGWKSEYESENESFISNPNEIKQAINILKKANLLSTKGGNVLEKLGALMKSPGNTQKIELLLQIHNLQGKSKGPSVKNPQKPPLKVPKLKKTELAATPKAAFIFTDDMDLAKTILSSENPLSARQPEENLEIMEELSKSSDLKDVQLEDLLKIPFLFPELQMATGVIPNPAEVNNSEQKDYLSYLSVLSPSEVKIPSPAKKQSSGFDYQSTGISSQSGLRSRITLKTGGSENSQKVFTPGSRGKEESFNFMSSFYDCSTPLSTLHLETNDSDDVSEYFGEVYDKHADSIMPTDKAKKLIGRKTKEALGKVNREDVAVVVEGFKCRLEQTLRNFRTNFELFRKIYENRDCEGKSVEKERNGKNFGIEEGEIRELLRKNHLVKLNMIKKKIEEEKNKVIDLKREDLQKYWRTKMLELNAKLQQAEWKKSARKREEKEKIQDFYQEVYEEALKKEKILLESDIDQHYKMQFQEKLKKVRKGFDRFRLSEDLEEKLKNERMKWPLEKEVKEKINQKIENENFENFKRAEMELRGKFEEKGEVKCMFQREENEKTLKSIKKTKKLCRKVDEDLTQQWITEAKTELKSEVFHQAIYQYKISLTPIFTKDITRSLNLTTDAKVLKNEQEKVFKSISEELSLTFEFFKKESEAFYKKETSEIESEYIKNLQTTIKIKADQKFLIKEKELYINFIKKSENLKTKLKKELEDKFSHETKKTKNTLIKEKAILAQFRAKKNIQISQLDSEINTNLQKLAEETLFLSLKQRETHQRIRTEDEIVFRTEDVIAQSSKHTVNSLSMVPESFKDLHPFYIPPSFSAKEIRAKNESTLKSPRVLPNAPHCKPTHFISNKSTLQDSSNSKSLSFDCLKPKSKEKSKNLIKQSVYYELLKEKFGFIKPRLK